MTLRNRWLGAVAMVVGCALLAGCGSPSKRTTAQTLLWPAGKSLTEGKGNAGPTLRLDYGQSETPGNPVHEFMYFVPLISPEPVTVTQTPGNTQRARVTSAARQFSETAFSAVCEFEISGEGRQKNVFDHSANIRRHERQLKEGGALERQLGSISVEGAGSGRVEVEGVISNRVPTVSEVRLRFNAGGRPSPIRIGIHDIQQRGGEYRPANELVAQVNTLTFRREPARPKMHVTVASVNRKDAGDGLWQKFVGGVKGMAVNLVIKPIAVEAVGHAAMLDFGLALAAEEPVFTFPKARNLKTTEAPAP